MKNFGNMVQMTGKDPMSEIEFVAGSGREFYERWYNRQFAFDPIKPKQVDPELIRLILLQVAEYAASGQIISEKCVGQPTIVVMGDRPKMAAFMSCHPAVTFGTINAVRVY